jgi:hypothetical protein
MNKDMKKRIAAASSGLAAVFAILLGEDEATVAEAMKAQAQNTKVRETGTDDDEDEAPPAKKRGRPAGAKNKAKDDDEEDDEPVVKKKGPKPPADDDDDDEDEDTEEEGGAIPKDAALNAMSRGDLKALATKHGLDGAGKNREDLVALLAEARDGGGKKAGKAKAKPAVDDDDDDEEEAPVKKSKKKVVAEDDDEEEAAPSTKKKKAAAADADEDKPEEDDYPATKIMKRNLETFFKLNKQVLKDAGFYGGKAKKGTQKAEHTYQEIMGDVDLIKEAWADNVWPEIQSKNWKKMEAEAAEIEDDDDE